MAVQWQTVTTQAGTVTQTIYTVPRDTTAIVVAGTVTNIGTDSDLNVHLVPDGDAAADDNKVLTAETVLSDDEYLLETVINHALTGGDTIQVLATSDGDLNIRLTIKEIS